MKEVIVDAEDLVCLNKEKLQELIRCKDCKWWRSNKKECIEWYDSPYAPADGYCFRAERKENGK